MGKIVNVTHAHYITSGGTVRKRIYKDQFDNKYFDSELDFFLEGEYIPDYWTKLEHQYAGMAMQGMLAGTYYQGLSHDRVVEDAQYVAHALVEKMKEERK